jgi:hypothetical protein
MLKKALALLDHRWLTRYGSLRNLVSLAGVVVVVLVAFIVALANLFTSVGPVPLVFLGIAVVILGLVVIQKIQVGRSLPEIDSDLGFMIYAAQQEERRKVADQIAKEEVDREAKRFR